MEYRGYNRKDTVGLGAYSIKAVAAGSPARVKLLESLGLKTAKSCGAAHSAAPLEGQASCCTWANLLWGNQHHLNKAHFTPAQLRHTQASTTFGSATLKPDAVADVAFQTIWADNVLRRNLASRVGAGAAAVVQSSPSPQAAFVQFTNPNAAKRVRSSSAGPCRGRGSGKLPATSRATSHSPARTPRTSGAPSLATSRGSARSSTHSPSSPLSQSRKRGLDGATPATSTASPSPTRASSRSFLSPPSGFRPIQQTGASPVNEVRMAAEAERRKHAVTLEQLNARIHLLESREEDRLARGAGSDAPMSVSRLETDPHIRAAVRQYTSFYSHKSFQAWLKVMNIHGRMAGVNPGTVAHPPLGHDAGLYTTDQSPVHEGVWCETINALVLQPGNTDPHLIDLEADSLVQVIRDPVAKGVWRCHCAPLLCPFYKLSLCARAGRARHHSDHVRACDMGYVQVPQTQTLLCRKRCGCRRTAAQGAKCHAPIFCL